VIRPRGNSLRIVALLTLIGLMAPAGVFSAEPSNSSNQTLQKKHRKKAKKKHTDEIFLSNDDLPKNGRHYDMVPQPATPPAPVVPATVPAAVPATVPQGSGSPRTPTPSSTTPETPGK